MITAEQLIYTGRGTNLKSEAENAKKFDEGVLPMGATLIARLPTGGINTLGGRVDTFIKGYIDYIDASGKKRIGERSYLLRKSPQLFTTEALMEGAKIAENSTIGRYTLGSIKSELAKREKVDYKPITLTKLKEYVDSYNRAILREAEKKNLPIREGMKAALEKHAKDCKNAGLPAPVIEISRKMENIEFAPWQKELQNYMSYMGKVQSFLTSKLQKQYWELKAKYGQRIADVSRSYIVEAGNRLATVISCMMVRSPIVVVIPDPHRTQEEVVKHHKKFWDEMIKTMEERLEVKVNIPEPGISLTSYIKNKVIPEAKPHAIVVADLAKKRDTLTKRVNELKNLIAILEKTIKELREILAAKGV